MLSLGIGIQEFRMAEVPANTSQVTTLENKMGDPLDKGQATTLEYKIETPTADPRATTLLNVVEPLPNAPTYEDKIEQVMKALRGGCE